jgi:adenosylmethionine-8-amino-7-oxononanoate aminotransferase
MSPTPSTTPTSAAAAVRTRHLCLHFTRMSGYQTSDVPVMSRLASATAADTGEGILEHVRNEEGPFRTTLEKLLDLPLVGDVRGDPVIQLSPPLICNQSHFTEMEQIIRAVLTEAESLL